MQSPRETLICRYRYDPLDRLIANALLNKPEHQRFYCKGRLATEIHGAVRHCIVQHDDQLLAEQQSEGQALGTTLLATDKQRSVLGTLNANQPRQSITYTPYGHRQTGGGLLSLLGFNGERPDPATGCYLLGNGYRAFNSVLMMFASPDSLSPFGKGGINTYVYCQGDPINNSDPTGHFILPSRLKALASTWRINAKSKSLSRLPLSPPAYSEINYSRVVIPQTGRPPPYSADNLFPTSSGAISTTGSQAITPSLPLQRPRRNRAFSRSNRRELTSQPYYRETLRQLNQEVSDLHTDFRQMRAQTTELASGIDRFSASVDRLREDMNQQGLSNNRELEDFRRLNSMADMLLARMDADSMRRSP